MNNCTTPKPIPPMDCTPQEQYDPSCCPPPNEEAYCDRNIAILDSCEMHYDPYTQCGDLCDCLPCFEADDPKDGIALTPEAKDAVLAMVTSIFKLFNPFPNPCGCDGEPYLGTGITDPAVAQQATSETGELLYTDNITGEDTTKPEDAEGKSNLPKIDMCCGNSTHDLMNSVFLHSGVDPYAQYTTFDDIGVLKGTGVALNAQARENLNNLLCCVQDRIKAAPELIL